MNYEVNIKLNEITFKKRKKWRESVRGVHVRRARERECLCVHARRKKEREKERNVERVRESGRRKLNLSDRFARILYRDDQKTLQQSIRISTIERSS